MLTAAVRDLHRANPGRFQTDVRTSAEALWQENEDLTSLSESDSAVEVIDMHYPLIHQCNQRPYHFIHGYAQHLEQKLDVSVPITEFRGSVQISDHEKRLPCPGIELGVPERFWILVAGGKYDYTAKWWNPASFQKVVDHFAGRITFVQCGEAGHWHSPLNGVVNLIGKSTLRDFVRLMYHADGVVCPVTFAMHLAAAVESKPGRPPHRPCVVVAGGREPAHWESYTHHQFLSTNGALSCCLEGGCWKSRCQLVGDGDAKDHDNICTSPVQISPDLRIPKCMDMITPEDVIRRIELYYQGGVLQYAVKNNDVQETAKSNGRSCRTGVPKSAHLPLGRHDTINQPKSQHPASSVSFYHGLGDCSYFAPLIAMYVKRGYPIEVECTPDKSLLFEAAGATTIRSGAVATHSWGYPPGGTFSGQGQFWQGSKPGHNVSEAPLPFIGQKADLWEEYCSTKVDVTKLLPAAAFETVDRWLYKLPRPIVLLHTKGNSGQERKSLPDQIASEFYTSLLDRFDGTLILMDWDNRVPRLASGRVRHLDNFGSCSTAVMFALMARSQLLIGIDSGPLHAAQLTEIPSVGIWMPGHYPATYTLPRRQQLNLVLRDHTKQWNKFKRIPWNIVEHPGETYDPNILADHCCSMLASPKYLHGPDIGHDVQLQSFIKSCRGIHPGNAFASYADRHRSFDVLFREIKSRFSKPTVVETGTIRAEEDWAGAGFFTYLAGACLSRLGGHLHSVEVDVEKCKFARDWTRVFGSTVTVHEGDSVSFLQQFRERIDVLYLDSLDTTESGHAEHCVREFEAAATRLHDHSLLVVDDTPWDSGEFIGKGSLLVPQLLKSGWRIQYAGYQVVLSR
jgi:ADP-heptose:LPS heptosyltransferase